MSAPQESRGGLARPRQVTTATVMGAVAGVVLVLSLFDTLARTRTPETREAIDEVLSRPPGDGLGVDVEQVVTAMRATVYVSAALAATAVVLAVFLLQRHRGARVGLTVVAAMLVLTVPVAGPLPLFVAAAAGLAWTRPARDWYAGRAPAASPPPAALEPPAASPPPAAPGPPPPQVQGPGAAFPGADPQPQVAFSPAPSAYAAQLPAAHLVAGRRPGTVTAAAVLTWLGAGGVAAATALFGLVLATRSEVFVEELDRTAAEAGVTVTADQALATGWAVTAVLLGWSLASMLLAVFAYRRSNAARVALAASSSLAALLSLVTIMSLVSVVTLLLAGATTVLLFTGGANEWYSRRALAPTPPGEPLPPSGPPFAPPRERQKPW